MSRRTSIRKRCLDCSAGSHTDVMACQHTDCHLYPYRTGAGKHDAKARDKAIKSYCLWCGINRAEVLHCPTTTCPLYPYRKTKAERTTRTTEFCNDWPYTRHFQTSDTMTIHLEAPGT